MRSAAILSLYVFLAAGVAGCMRMGASISGNTLMTAMGQGLLGPAFNTLSVKERRQALEAEYKALEYAKAGDTVSWGAEGQHAWGSVAARSPYQVGSLNCRQYSHSFTIGGLLQIVHGSACRNPDGSWMPLT